MGKDEFTTMMQQVADTVPSQASAEIVSLIIANLILLYDQQGEWPKKRRKTKPLQPRTLKRSLKI